MTEYTPVIFDNPKTINVISAWQGIPNILLDIITRFRLRDNLALEFGVERGYSTTALAHYFKHVIGVDPFYDKLGFRFADVQTLLSAWHNIELHESKFEDYIKQENRFFNLIHIDIIHEYQPTFDCGDWSLKHSDFVCFHDTQSYPAVMQACQDLAEKHKARFYNYPHCNGLGMLWKS
jgi:hypothetical protein